ncbi:hypothetical protein RGQ15_07110 [Paracoccus sp. MBLB3053]|uniref:Uncharacterized protein n=1 Tax=Paracoccus aurantius TaxID=3073814 RepID=A0ABU2HRE9_9RHOB|nr:hypothetical protein [Paracoccus sp. MBLB3053]MDS9467342.1 hypothetical protein [Paracoccus sp. MBLB3053]
MTIYTAERYQTLCMMIAKGVTSLEVNGEKVVYRSLAEMLRIKGLMEAELGLGAAQRPRQHYPAYRKE